MRKVWAHAGGLQSISDPSVQATSGDRGPIQQSPHMWVQAHAQEKPINSPALLCENRADLCEWMCCHLCVCRWLPFATLVVPESVKLQGTWTIVTGGETHTQLVC
jgi:hypothetical protein